jgi:hypothetical protein
LGLSNGTTTANFSSGTEKGEHMNAVPMRQVR